MLFNIVLEVLATAIRRKGNKKESKWEKHLSALYLGNPKDSTRKLLELISESGTAGGYKINHGNLLHFYTPTMKDQKEKLRK